MSLPYLEELKSRYVLGLTLENGKHMNEIFNFTTVNYSRERLRSSPKKWEWARYEQDFELGIETPQYVEDETDWLFGFYCDKHVSFDLYLDGKLQNHYDLVKNQFAPLMRSSGVYFIRCQLNNPEELLELRNIQTTDALCQIKNEVSIYLLGGVLNAEESIRTQSTGISEECEECVFVPSDK